MKFYTTAKVYKNKILHKGYVNGRRFQEKVSYQPYLFATPGYQRSTDKETDTKYKNIEGQLVERIDFDSISDQGDFIKLCKDVGNFKIYGITNYEYLFLNDQYSGESCEYDSSLI